MIESEAGAAVDLAEVLATGGKVDEANAALERAAELYERKENVPATRRTHARLAELRTARAAELYERKENVPATRRTHARLAELRTARADVG